MGLDSRNPMLEEVWGDCQMLSCLRRFRELDSLEAYNARAFKPTLVIAEKLNALNESMPREGRPNIVCGHRLGESLKP